MNNFLRDVLHQAEAMRAVLSHYFAPEFIAELQKIGRCAYKRVVFTGMGSSNFACIGAALFLNEHKQQAMVVSSGQLLHYGTAALDADDLLVLVSQSGESAEIVALLNKIADKSKVVGITNEPNSRLAEQAAFTLLMNVEAEESVTTRTYLATVLINNILVQYLAGGETAVRRAELEQSITALQEILTRYSDMSATIADFWQKVRYVSCVGRGPSCGSALAAGLFFKEVAKFPSEGMDAAEFRHGPMEIVDERFGAVVFAPQGKTEALSLKLATDIAEKGGRVLLVSNCTNPSTHTNILNFNYAALPEYLSPIVEIFPAQLACNMLAEKGGFVPGEFRWSSKVTASE